MSLEALERKVESMECRVRAVEVSDAKMNERMDALIQRLDNVSKWLMALIAVMIPSLMTALGFLINSYVKGG